MQDDNIIDELEAEPIETNNSVEELINYIQNQQYTDAEQAFNDTIGDRLQSTLDQAKMRIADTMFNAQQEVDDEDSFEYDIDDEEDLDLDLDLELDDFDDEDEEV